MKNGAKKVKDLKGNKINVTSFLNQRDPKNIKKQIFDLLANGKGKLEITNQTISLCFSNLYDKQKFNAEIQ